PFLLLPAAPSLDKGLRVSPCAGFYLQALQVAGTSEQKAGTSCNAQSVSAKTSSRTHADIVVSRTIWQRCALKITLLRRSPGPQDASWLAGESGTRSLSAKICQNLRILQAPIVSRSRQARHSTPSDAFNTVGPTPKDLPQFAKTLRNFPRASTITSRLATIRSRFRNACAPFVLLLMYLFAPIAYPIAKLLDYVLGANEAHTYKKAELKSFLQFHRTGEEPLRDDEISILNGVLELNTKSVEGIMTPMKDVVTLAADAIMDDKLVEKILLSGYSRFPVHEPGNPDSFIGLLLIKKLLKYDPSSALPVSSFPLSIIPEAQPSINCFQALDYFQTGRAHLLLISRTPGKAGGAIGVITLEDIIEEILSEEIVDETDRYEDNVSKQHAKRMTTAAVMRGLPLIFRSSQDRGAPPRRLRRARGARSLGREGGRTDAVDCEDAVGEERLWECWVIGCNGAGY
ncbi:hypothetical protein B0H16DRAFT_800065, partial [Mycena metata]